MPSNVKITLKEGNPNKCSITVDDKIIFIDRVQIDIKPQEAVCVLTLHDFDLEYDGPCEVEKQQPLDPSEQLR